MKTSLLLAAVLLAAPLAPVQAQPAAPAIQGKTLEGKAFSLASLKGKVVLVMFWSTDCAVCRDKMGELRRNYQGWAGQPFELVLVNTDARMADLQAYEKIISLSVPVKQRFVQLWSGEPGYRDSIGQPGQLPSSYLVDKAGKVVQHWQGRIPPEAWDQIAELL
jgi:peroxiredoxin